MIPSIVITLSINVCFGSVVAPRYFITWEAGFGHKQTMHCHYVQQPFPS